MKLNDKNRDRTHGAAPDELDSLLAVHCSAGDDLAPSSGFALSILETLQAEASAPPPIPFPWRRVVPGLIVVLCAMASFGVFALHELRAAGSHSMLLSLTSGQHIHLTTLEQAFAWIAIATCLSIAAVAGCMRLAVSGSKMRI